MRRVGEQRVLLIAVLAATVLSGALAAGGLDVAPLPPAEAGSVQRLAHALADANSFKVRLQAALLLGQSGSGQAVEPLVATLHNDAHHAVRAASATALGRLGTATAVPHLLKTLALDEAAVARAAAARSLGGFERAVALPHVVASYASTEPAVRRRVVAYLVESRTPSSESVLVRALGDVPTVLDAVTQALTTMPPADALRFLSTAIDHRDPAVRVGAVTALRQLGSAEAARLLLTVHEREAEHDKVRQSTRSALRQYRDLLPVDRFLEDAASAPDKQLRGKALKLLGALGGERAQRALVDALSDRDLYVRGTAVMALRDLGNPGVVPELERLAADPANQRIVHLLHHTMRQLRESRDDGT